MAGVNKQFFKDECFPLPFFRRAVLVSKNKSLGCKSKKVSASGNSLLTQRSRDFSESRHSANLDKERPLAG